MLTCLVSYFLAIGRISFVRFEFKRLVCCAAAMFALMLVSSAQADDPFAEGANRPGFGPQASQRALEMAELRLRLYTQVDYPLQIQELERQIKLAQAELAVFQRRIAEYRRANRFRYTNPFTVSQENAELSALEANTRLAHLRQEKHLRETHFRDRRRLLELEISAIRSQLDPSSRVVEPRNTPPIRRHGDQERVAGRLRD